MKTKILSLILMLVMTVSCKPKEEEYVPIDERLVWDQEMVPEIYEGNRPVPTHQVFTCRRNISDNSQRYFRLKFKKNEGETSVSPGGVETTVHRFAQLKQDVKIIHNPSQVSWTDFVWAAVDITIQKLPTGIKITAVRSQERPEEPLDLHAPDGSDILQSQPGDEVIEVNFTDPASLRISLESRFNVIGKGEEPEMECQYLELESDSK